MFVCFWKSKNVQCNNPELCEWPSTANDSYFSHSAVVTACTSRGWLDHTNQKTWIHCHCKLFFFIQLCIDSLPSRLIHFPFSPWSCYKDRSEFWQNAHSDVTVIGRYHHIQQEGGDNQTCFQFALFGWNGHFCYLFISSYFAFPIWIDFTLGNSGSLKPSIKPKDKHGPVVQAILLQVWV